MYTYTCTYLKLCMHFIELEYVDGLYQNVSQKLMKSYHSSLLIHGCGEFPVRMTMIDSISESSGRFLK